MKIIPEPLVFEWDEGNRNKNWIKHSVEIKEIEELFNNKPIVLFDDKKHSNIEKRFGLLGKTNEGRLLSVVFAIRKEKIRVITARNMSRAERRVYEEVKTNS